MRRYWMIICGLLCCLTSMAQGSLQEINDIKKSKRYVYAMAASAQSKEDATQRAKDLLLLEVEQWLKEEKTEDFAGYVVKVKNNTAQIETQRGKLFRVFVYVAKKDILPYAQNEEVETVKMEASSTDTASVKPEQSVAPKVTLTSTEEQMLKIDSFEALTSYINENKANDKITDYGKYATMPKDADVYVFVYNPQGGISARIKRFGAESLNLSTLQKDDVANYKGCGAIWVKIKE